MPVTAKTKIINASLALIGEPGYDDIEVSPAPPKLAKVLGLIDDVTDWVLRRHPWLCCMKYASLTVADRAGNWKYPYVYELPVTCVKVYEVASDYPFAKGAETVSAAQKIVIWSESNAGLDVAYVELKPYEAFDADLRNVIAHELAARGAGAIQEDYAKGERLHKKAMELLALGEGAESGEEGNQDVLVRSTFAGLRASAG